MRFTRYVTSFLLSTYLAVYTLNNATSFKYSLISLSRLVFNFNLLASNPFNNSLFNNSLFNNNLFNNSLFNNNLFSNTSIFNLFSNNNIFSLFSNNSSFFDRQNR